MQIEGDYWKDGYAVVRGLYPPALTHQLLNVLRDRLDSAPLENQVSATGVTKKRVAVQVYSKQFPTIEAFLWGLTPVVAQAVGKDLLPTYCYFRAYQRDDTCFVHNDRPACEVSLSLTLGYSDGIPWALDVARQRLPTFVAPTTQTFDDEPYASAMMQLGDAVIYQGVFHRHGRVTPNPNSWSAHMFMHWVDANGPWRDRAFEHGRAVRDVDFAIKQEK